MKTLGQIKDEIAKHLSYKSWVELMSYDYEYGLGISKVYSVEDLMDMVAKRYAVNVAAQALKDASESARIIDTEWCPTYGSYGKEIPSNIIVDEQSILQTEIKLT